MGIYVKKYIAAPVLAMVTLTVLMTAMLPHHHHREEVCFAEKHCADDRDHLAGHESNASDHEHDLPLQGADCLVVHVYLLPDIKTFSGKQKVNGEQLFPLGTLNRSLDEPVGPGIRKSHSFVPPGAGLHCPVVNGTVSLRGPPCFA